MTKNSVFLECLIGGLLVTLLMLPISMGGRGGTLFWVVFGVLTLYLVALVVFVIANRHHQH